MSNFRVTEREHEILRLLPLENKEIAQRLYITPSTAMTHVNNLRVKSGATSKVSLLAIALKEGKISIDEIIIK